MNRFFASCLIILLTSITANSQNWSALRGDDGYGTVTTKDGVLTQSGNNVRFETRWKKTLGSGYSSVVVADGKVVTMYTDGTDDIVICLNAEDGDEVWKVTTGPIFKGENGSFDGPLSTPIIHNQKVYVFTAVGVLTCYNLTDGELIWTRDMPKETGVAKPLYGFVVSPIVAAETLILQVGAEENSVYGFDLNTGETKWSAGNDRISSQTPSLINLSGRQILLAAGGKNLTGIDPTNGDIVFEYAHGGGNGGAMTPVPIGDGKVLLTLDDQFSKAVTLQVESDNKVNVSEQWQERSIKNTYNVPVLDGGNVFAFSTRILTCVDPESGRAHWKTRKPGDGFLITVDGHMIISTKKGSLHLAKATAEGYQEFAETKLFDDLVWSIPAYSNNSIFARSLGEIARVDLVKGGGAIPVNSKEQPAGANFRDLLSQMGEDKEANEKVIDKWIEDQDSFPFIEDNIAHFVYRGDHDDVALAGDFFGARQEKPMTRVDNTDLHYMAIGFEPDQRANYCYLINFKPQVDPLNPRVMTSSMYAGEMEFAVRLRGAEPLKMSWFGMSQWKQPEYLAENDVQNEIMIDTHEIGEEESLTEFHVQHPPGYDAEADKRYPVAYVFDGASARTKGQMETGLNNLFQMESSKAPATIVVYLNGFGPDFLTTVAEEIVPLVDEKYRTIADRKSRLAISFGFAGEAALVSTTTQNELFGNAAVQSPLAFADSQNLILDTAKEVKLPTTIHLQWGRFDMFNPHENWNLRTISESLFKDIGQNENINMVGGMVNDSTDWSSWKNRYEEIFSLLNSE